MDRECPSDYVETTATSISHTRVFLERFPYNPSSVSPPLVQPILTPRFAISCTDTLLSALGDMANQSETKLPIQTHLSENKAEIKQAHELFPGCNYAGVYGKYGLLGPKTILAHCVHLEEEEEELIHRTGAGISHCPTSNLHIDSGMAQVRRLLDMGIKVILSFKRKLQHADIG